MLENKTNLFSYTLHPKLRFTAETEDDCTLNYLDLSIRRTTTGSKTAIYRKPTFRDTIIPFTSNHPMQHKYAAVKYLYNRLDSYNLQQTENQQELNIIHNILHNNSFPIKPHKPRTPKPVCPDCNKAYMGQTRRQFSSHYKEHKTAWHNNSTTSNFAQHLTEESHSSRPMNQTMQITHYHKKEHILTHWRDTTST